MLVAQQITDVPQAAPARGGSRSTSGCCGRACTRRARFVDPSAIGSVDVALWDIAGKAAGLPVHRLLGTCRHKIPVYFSSGIHATPQDYADEAIYWREQGWKGYKLHPPTAPWATTPGLAPTQADIDACVAVHEAVGGDMALMLDASWAYCYADALIVGPAIEELGYALYEDPLPAEDIYGYTKLKRTWTSRSSRRRSRSAALYALPQWIMQQATDALRGDVVIKGGITGMMKIAHLAEAFRLKCEVHDAYNAMNNVASAHVVMAIPNCDWFEVLAFNRAGNGHSLEHLSYGLAEPVRIDGDGFLHAPTAPGLGIEVDWELIEFRASGRGALIRGSSDGDRLRGGVGARVAGAGGGLSPGSAPRHRWWWVRGGV